MTTLATDVLVRHAVEAEARRLMARKVALKRKPGTHGEQAALVEDIDGLLDQWAGLSE